MEHCAPHTRAVHTATCLERKVAGRENWFQLLELLPGGFHTCCGWKLTTTGCWEHVSKVAKGSYHLQFVRPDLGFSLKSGCSKLTASLVNVLLNFQKLISQIYQYLLLKNVISFCSAKASLIYSTKNFSVFVYKVIKHLTNWPLNELVKLTMLWTTGPRSLENILTLWRQKWSLNII